MPRVKIVRDDAPDFSSPVKTVTANFVREWVRAALVPKALQRLYEIGMGVTEFETPVGMGTKFIEAPAAVQAKALQAVLMIGVPGQLGLVGESDQLPGVIAVGEWEMADAREEAHGQRYLPYAPPEGHEVIEVNAGSGTASFDDTAAVPPPPLPSTPTLAKQILARRKARKTTPPPSPPPSPNGNGNGTHG